MYVCNCNGIRERQVLEAAELGAREPCEVFLQHRCAAKCGRCIEEMRLFLDMTAKNSAVAAQ